MLRLILVVLALAFLVALPFAVWGEQIEDLLSVDRSVEWMRETGWAWAAGIGLIAADIVLPVPSSAIMAGLGILYGPILGGLFASLGSIIAGTMGYWLCRAVGPRTAERLAGAQGLSDARVLFDRWGFALIVVSRWLPVLPETVAFVAGLIAMPFGRFLLALVAGAVPLGFLFATAGHLGQETPLLIMILCAIAPVVLWIGIRAFWRGGPAGSKN